MNFYFVHSSHLGIFKERKERELGDQGQVIKKSQTCEVSGATKYVAIGDIHTHAQSYVMERLAPLNNNT